MGLEWKWLQAPLEVLSGGSAQDMLSREGLDCRLHIGGWYGLSSPLQKSQRWWESRTTSTGAEKPLRNPCRVCNLPLVLQGGLWEQVAACAACQLCKPEQSRVLKEDEEKIGF